MNYNNVLEFCDRAVYGVFGDVANKERFLLIPTLVITQNQMTQVPSRASRLPITLARAVAMLV